MRRRDVGSAVGAIKKKRNDLRSRKRMDFLRQSELMILSRLYSIRKNSHGNVSETSIFLSKSTRTLPEKFKSD